MAAPKKSNRREEILQALAQMLESTQAANASPRPSLPSKWVYQRPRFIATFPARHACLRA